MLYVGQLPYFPHNNLSEYDCNPHSDNLSICSLVDGRYPLAKPFSVLNTDFPSTIFFYSVKSSISYIVTQLEKQKTASFKEEKV